MTIADMPVAGRSILLEGISWASYEQILEEHEGSNLRFTFDQGRLEIMAPLSIHESIKKAAACVIELYALEMDIMIRPLGSTTFKRVDLLKGLEPDECHYVACAAGLVGKEMIDLAVDPPPDLAIEVDYTSRSIPRQPIYSALGVPELWRHDGVKFQYLARNKQGKYVPIVRSRAFPDLPLADLNRFVEIAKKGRHNDAMKALRQWIRDRK
jgi:Uma2 family endonuclease